MASCLASLMARSFAVEADGSQLESWLCCSWAGTLGGQSYVCLLLCKMGKVAGPAAQSGCEDSVRRRVQWASSVSGREEALWQ